MQHRCLDTKKPQPVDTKYIAVLMMRADDDDDDGFYNALIIRAGVCVMPHWLECPDAAGAPWIDVQRPANGNLNMTDQLTHGLPLHKRLPKQATRVLRQQLPSTRRKQYVCLFGSVPPVPHHYSATHRHRSQRCAAVARHRALPPNGARHGARHPCSDAG